MNSPAIPSPAKRCCQLPRPAFFPLHRSALVLALAVLALTAASSRAANRFWSGAGTWNTSTANWGTVTGGPYNTFTWVNANNDTGVFEGAAGTASLGAGITVGGLQFDTASYIVTANTLTFGVSGNIVANQNATINSAIAATSGLTITKTGSGTLTLGGNNTYAAGTTVSIGTLKAGSLTGLSSNSVFSIAAGAILDLGGFNNTIKSLAADTATSTITNSTGAATLKFSGTSPAAHLFTGSLGVQMSGSQNVGLNNAANTFSGGFTLGINDGVNARILLSSRTLGVGGPGTLTSGSFGTGAITLGVSAIDRPQIMFQAGVNTINNAIVVNSTNGNSDSIATFRVDSTGNIIAGTVNANLANVAFKNSGGVGSVSLTNTISGVSGVMLTASAGTSLNVTLANTSTVNTNTYAGDTTISSVKETLTLGAANQIPNGVGKGNLLMTSGAFNLGGFSETINGLSGSGTVDGISGTPTLTVGDNDATGTFSGVIKNTAGTLGLTKLGTGTLTLSGANTFGGAIQVNGGLLVFANTGAKPAGTATTISTSSIGLGVGAVSGDYSDANVAALFNNNSLSGFNLVAGSGVALDSTAGNFTQTTGLTAARSLTKLGVNTLTLSGNNTYSGATTNSAGTLKAGSITGLSPNSAFSVATGATLDLGGFSNTIKSLSTATGTITDSSSPGSGGTLRISTALAATTSQLFTGSLGLQIYGAGTVHVLNNSANTFSGGTILGNGSGSTQTREILNGVTVGAGTPGALTGGIYGKGAITIGAVTTDLSQIMFQNPNPCTINNAIVVNSALGTDIAGTFRVDSVGNIIAGTINANLANLAFKNGGTVGSVSLTNTISGTSGLMLLASAGTSLNVILTNNGTANSYAGDTTISSVKETLTLGAANQIPNGVGKGNLLMTNGTFNLGGFSETINGLSGSGTVDGITGTPTLTVGDNNATGTFAGVIKNTAGTFALTKIGTGTLTLSGISTYSGNTTISAGKLQGVVGGSIASSTVILNAATNGVSITDNTKGWTNAALTVSAASVLEFSFGAITPSTSVSPLKITGLAAFTTTPTVSIVVNSGLAAGTYPLMTWGSTSGTAPTTAGLSVSTLAPGTVASLSISGNTLNLVIGSTAVYWDNNGAVAGFGTAAGTWAAPTTGDATQGWSSDATGGTLPVNVTTTTNNPVNFGNGATGLGGGTITVSGSVTNNNVTFASGSGEIILSGGTLNFPPSATITVNNSSNTISSVLAGAGTSLTKAGTGTLTLAGANSYAGVTTVSVGTLTATNASALGATSSNTVVSSGATLRIAGGVSIAEPISIAGNGVGGNGAISSAGNNTLTAAVTSSGGRLQTEGLDTLTLTGGITSTTPNTIMVGDFTFTNNPINVGANGINFAGDGAAIPPVTGKTIRLNAAGNSWTNALLFFAAIVRLGGNDVMPVGASVQFGWTDVDNSRSTLDLNGFNQTVATIEKGQPNVSGVNVSITGGGTLTVNQSAASKDFNGVISDGATATTLIKTNVGNLILSGANTYSGNTTISAGTLALTNSGSIANSTNLIVAGGATLNVSGVSGSFSLAASQRLSGNGTVTGPITINGTVLPGSSIGTLTLSGAVTNNGTIMAEITNGPSADKIVFSGSFRNNGGTLTVTNLGTLVNGTTYDLFDFNGGAPTGVAFSTVNLPGGLGHWNTADLLVGGTITFANNAPVAGNFGLNVAVGGSVSVAAIGKYASDANGDALTITVVSAPANGTASIVGGTNFTYVSTNSAASDSFTYTVSDGFTTSTGTVTVQTYSPVGFNILSGPTPVGGGQYELNYLGLPGQQYAIDETSSLTPPITWSPVTTNTAAANGALTFTITPANPSGFFRTRSVP